MKKGTIHQEDMTLVNIYAPNIGAPNYVKQILMDIKGEVNRNTVVAGDFHTSLTSVDRLSRQKVNKEMVALYDTLDQMDLIDTFRASHHKAAEYTFFFQVHLEYFLG